MTIICINLTYQYLNRIPYGNYNIIKNQINYDIQNIKQIKKDKEPKSAKNISLKQAYDLYKKVMKFQKGMQFAFWQTVIEVGGKYAEFPISAYVLIF